MEQRILDKIIKDLPKNYLSKYGGSLGGALNFYNNTWNNVGDDVAFGDCNNAGKLGIKGLNGKTGIHFTPNSGTVAQDLYVDGAGTMTISGKLSSTFVGNLTGKVTGSSSSAGKLSTARNIALSGDLTGSVNFDGSSNVTLTAYGYSSAVIKNNTNNYPFCRIAHCEGTESFADKSITLYISQSFAGGSFGILRVCIRSDEQTTTSKSYCHGEVIWLVRHGFDIDQFQLGVMNVKGNWSADLFYKCNNVYASINVKQLEASGRTSQGRTWTLINCSEPPGTVTTKNNTTNCYRTIASYKTYSNIVTAIDVLFKGMKKQINSSVDFNSITENGIYKVQDCRSSANKPDGYVYGILNVYKPVDDEENRLVQIYYPHNSYPIMVRWNNKGWSNWYRIGKGTRWEDIPDRPGLASSTADGLLSKSDKSKLDSIKNYAGSSTPGGAATNSLKLNGYGTGKWGAIPIVKNDGGIEIGKYIDFHLSSSDTTDYAARITASSNGLTLSGTTSGTFSGSWSGNMSVTKSLTSGENISAGGFMCLNKDGKRKLVMGGNDDYCWIDRRNSSDTVINNIIIRDSWVGLSELRTSDNIYEKGIALENKYAQYTDFRLDAGNEALKILHFPNAIKMLSGYVDIGANTTKTITYASYTFPNNSMRPSLTLSVPNNDYTNWNNDASNIAIVEYTKDFINIVNYAHKKSRVYFNVFGN